MRVLANSGWLMGEQFVRLAVSFVLGVWTARHLGPADFGLLSYAIAYSGIFAVVATLGLNRILVRELVAAAADPERLAGLISTAFALRLGAASLLYGAALASTWYSGDVSILLTALVAGGTIFGAADCADLYFQSKVESRHPSRARLAAFTVSSSARIALLLGGADVAAFAALTLAEGLLSLCLLQASYRGHGPRLRWYSIRGEHARTLLRESAPEIVAGLGGILFMRLDQVMLQHMMGSAAVGTFAVATRLTEIWYFVPVAIVASAFPGIVALREHDRVAYHRRIERLTGALVLLAYAVALGVSLVVVPLVPKIFGAAYQAASGVLLIQVWCGVFLVFAQTSGAWLMAERQARQNMYRSAVGLGVNVSANLLLIPLYGPSGAATGTLLSFISAYFLYDALIPSMRPMARVKVRALLMVPLVEQLMRRTGHRGAA